MTSNTIGRAVVEGMLTVFDEDPFSGIAKEDRQGLVNTFFRFNEKVLYHPRLSSPRSFGWARKLAILRCLNARGREQSRRGVRWLDDEEPMLAVSLNDAFSDRFLEIADQVFSFFEDIDQRVGGEG